MATTYGPRHSNNGTVSFSVLDRGAVGKHTQRSCSAFDHITSLRIFGAKHTLLFFSLPDTHGLVGLGWVLLHLDTRFSDLTCFVGISSDDYYSMDLLGA